MEVHSSDLTAACPRSVQLRLDGKAVGEYTTALLRGQLAHAALEIVHANMGTAVFDGNVADIVCNLATEKVLQLAENENRPVSVVAARELESIQEEVVAVVTAYVKRFSGYFDGCKVIGTELPVSWSMDGFDFASHIDLLFRDDQGQLHVWDWKYRDDEPLYAYLSRNLQLASYALCVREGRVQIGSDWIAFRQWPVVSWIHLPNLLPYKRNGDGFSKGDDRPIDKIVRGVRYDDGARERIVAELTMRRDMFAAGHYPAIPDPIGCHLCDSQAYCTQYHGSQL